MFVVLLVLSLLIPATARAQSFEVGGGVAIANSSEFEVASIGVAGRLAWNPIALIGLEAEGSWYPQGFPDQIAFSTQQFEGLFGITVGPRFDRVRPFARARAGFLTFAAASAPIACVTIYPPPLSCVLATGRTVPAFDFGGGLDVAMTRRTFARVDVGDRMLKYPGPSLTRTHADLDGFYSHDLRFAFGAGVKF